MGNYALDPPQTACERDRGLPHMGDALPVVCVPRRVSAASMSTLDGVTSFSSFSRVTPQLGRKGQWMTVSG